MIFISTSCVKAHTIKEAILLLYKEGFTNLELSGGTNYYPTIADDLIELKEKYNLNFILHNYFPPPQEAFVLNIASLNNEIYEASMNHIKKAIDLSKKLEINYFGFHAGFRLDIPVDQIGKKINRFSLFPIEEAMKRFCTAYAELKTYAGNNFNLYIENNVFSTPNAENYPGEEPFFLTSQQDYNDLTQKIDFKLLLDVAHLKVSCHTLNLDFTQEFSYLYQKSDYIHISDNDGLQDTNQELSEDSSLYSLLKKQDWKDKIITLEVYQGMESLHRSFNNINKI